MSIGRYPNARSQGGGDQQLERVHSGAGARGAGVDSFELLISSALGAGVGISADGHGSFFSTSLSLISSPILRLSRILVAGGKVELHDAAGDRIGRDLVGR